MFRIKETKHYQIYHKKDVPLSLVTEVILTGKRKKKGKNLIEFIKRSKKQEIYVLCRIDIKNNEIIVINAKKKVRK